MCAEIDTPHEIDLSLATSANRAPLFSSNCSLDAVHTKHTMEQAVGTKENSLCCIFEDSQQKFGRNLVIRFITIKVNITVKKCE